VPASFYTELCVWFHPRTAFTKHGQLWVIHNRRNRTCGAFKNENY